MAEVPQTLSRRYIKSFAGGAAHKFSSSANHYAWLAHHYGISRITVNLLTLSIEPPEFDISRNRTLAEQCRSSLLRNLERLKPPGAVTAAVLVAEFDIDDYVRKDNGTEFVGRSSFVVTLTDDRGKDWCGSVTWDRTIAQGDGFGDTNR